MESPSGNTINGIHDHPEAKQLGIKSGDWTDFYAGPPLKRQDLNGVTSNTPVCRVDPDK